nr:mutant BAHD acyltransferase protein [Turnera subulata x Turnera krapovickasii]UBU50655.1 mutant BAHD acyltransferase protein [Turnera subulata x Turnera krapovickasii]
MEVEITLRETIKPSSSTPPSKRILKLSLMDQFTPVCYTSLILFYPASVNQDHSVTLTERCQQLKISLSETLTHFYPLAGRLKDNASIECDDQGGEYIEARIKCLLSEFLVTPEAELLKQLLPAAIESGEAATGSMLLVQANIFDCGGMAIGVCVSHKIADAATLTTFVKCWSGSAHKSTEVMSPLFMGASIFPDMDLTFTRPSSVELMQGECATKRFVFDSAKIRMLKAKAASESVAAPTRVEAVSALIWKCAMAASRSNLGAHRKSVWSLSVNLRKRLAPPLPENYAGSCVGSILAHMEDAEVELRDLVGLIRRGNQEFDENYAKKLQREGSSKAICGFAKQFEELAMSTDIDFYNCTSWCKFQLYEADFGWGKPAWLSIASTSIKNVLLLIDTRDAAGIEAWLTLSEEDMAFFECNKELLEFATLNPSVSLSELHL